MRPQIQKMVIEMFEPDIPDNSHTQFWQVVLFLTATVLFMAGCDSWGSAASAPTFHLKVREWRDDAGQISKAELESLLKQEILPQLPALNNEQEPVLFVSGTLRQEETVSASEAGISDKRNIGSPDESDSVMMLEGRFLYSDRKVSAHLPVRVVVLGSIKGKDAQRRERLVQGVVKDLRAGLVANIRICNGSEKQWVDALDSPEPDEQILALALLRRYHVQSAVWKVVALLSDPRTEVALAAVETAAELANEKHVDRIIQIANGGGLEVEARCIQVLSRIGGPNAIAWLEMLALGHQNSQMRELSFNALKRLK